MPIKKLVVEELEVKDGEQEASKNKVGFKYSYFVDPETGKYYRPKSTYTVTGERLEDLFEEVEAG